MRVHAKINTTEMADFMGLKSRKTIENWEQGNSEPEIGQFIYYCIFTGFNPYRVMLAIEKSNSNDGTQKKYFEIEGCLNIDNMSFYRIKNKPMPLKASSNAPIPKTDLVDKLIKQKR
jgi:DNA-binding XRE family transcriptional regulator